MRLLIATGPFPPEAGGPATYVKLLLEELPKLGIKLSVLPFRSVAKWPYLIKHKIYFFKLLPLAARADIVFAQDPVSVGLPALCAAKLLGKRFVLRVGGDYAWEQGVQRFGVRDPLDEFVKDPSRYALPVRVLAAVQRFVARRAERIIVSGAYLKRIVIAWGIPEERITIVYNAFAPETDVPESKEELRARLHISGKTVVTAARLVPWKGVSVLIDAVLETPDIRLIVIGDGPERAALEQRAKGSDRISFAGMLSRPALFAHIKAADLFALNTGYEAGFSYQILEAMRIGTPVITTSAGDNAALIRSGENGYLVAYNDAEGWKRALMAPITPSVAGRGKETVAAFTPARMARETLAVLTS